MTAGATTKNSSADDLDLINHAIGDAESEADRAFFQELLAPAFSMVRPDGVRFDDRTHFLNSLTISSPRSTRIDSITVFDNRAIVICAVSKDGDSGPMQHRNIRIFTRMDSRSPWQLLSWVTEPLSPLGGPC
ncbi:MAG: nuclear transport factor 2 family protein [Nakamurella sp.]